MYTGIVDHLGRIVCLETKNQGMHLTIQCNFTDLLEGESIAVDGICITVVNPQARQFACDLSPETLKLTTAKFFTLKKPVNLERSLRLGDTLGGHFVMGHVDTTAQVVALHKHADFVEMRFSSLDVQAMPYMIRKGSVSVNGVSLTINEVYPDGFCVMLIPHTLERTNLQFLQPGDSVNIEYDTITRVIVEQFKQCKENLKI